MQDGRPLRFQTRHRTLFGHAETSAGEIIPAIYLPDLELHLAGRNLGNLTLAEVLDIIEARAAHQGRAA